jgi:hypothetical protein
VTPDWDPPFGLGGHDLIAWAGIAFGVVAAASRTMIPLRAFALASNLLLLVCDALERDWWDVALGAVLLAVGAWRLWQMLALVRRARATATRGEFSMEWLKPFMTARKLRAGETLFARGDVADAAHYVVRGSLRVAGAGVVLPRQELVGEMALFAEDCRRTATVEAAEDCDLLTIGYAELQELCAQNPAFSLFLLKTIAARLQARNDALEAGAG